MHIMIFIALGNGIFVPGTCSLHCQAYSKQQQNALNSDPWQILGTQRLQDNGTHLGNISCP